MSSNGIRIPVYASQVDSARNLLDKLADALDKLEKTSKKSGIALRWCKKLLLI